MIGISRDQWKLLGASLALGGNVRAGLEDNLYLPDGEMARSNGDLIAKARQMAEDVGRRAATVAEAREMLGVPKRARGDGMSELPLSRRPVLDLTRLLPGGFCSLLLADLGAEVLKVEDTGMGDYVRWAPPYYGDEEQQGARHPLGALPLAEPRQALDPARPEAASEGREALLRLVGEYDVVLDGFRPGVLDRLGVGYERMRERNPGIVYCAITGYGQTGPNTRARRPRHELPRPGRPARR